MALETATSMNPAVVSYFERRAGDYWQASQSWPWRWLRRREAAVVLECMGEVAGDDVLDLGCGAGYFSRLFASHGASRVVAVDFSPAMVANLPRDGIEGVVGDVTSVDLKRKFKRIVCTGVLEFVNDPQAVLSNARHHATREASMVLLVPRRNVWGRVYRFYHRRHGIMIHLFRPEDVERLATGAGWQAVRTRFVLPFTWIASFEPTPS